jgi:hypothetical protein
MKPSLDNPNVTACALNELDAPTTRLLHLTFSDPEGRAALGAEMAAISRMGRDLRAALAQEEQHGLTQEQRLRLLTATAEPFPDSGKRKAADVSAPPRRRQRSPAWISSLITGGLAAAAVVVLLVVRSQSPTGGAGGGKGARGAGAGAGSADSGDVTAGPFTVPLPEQQEKAKERKRRVANLPPSMLDTSHGPEIPIVPGGAQSTDIPVGPARNNTPATPKNTADHFNGAPPPQADPPPVQPKAGGKLPGKENYAAPKR